jgi:hypothetical protein
MYDWDMVSEFALERAVEVLAAANGAQCIGIGKVREDSNLIRTLELHSCRHT